MQQRVILHSEQVKRKGEIRYFQSPLQGTAIRIIAVEASAFLFSQAPPEVIAAPPVIEPVPAPAPQPSTGDCPNPGKAELTPVSNTVAGGVRTQSFIVGPAVNPGFQYQVGVYSVVITVVAEAGDTPATVAAKLAQAVNNTSLSEWNQYGSNTQNYKPIGSAGGDNVTVTTDSQHTFFGSGTGECPTVPPPPPPPPSGPRLLEFDPLFRIVRSERAGVLSLQSPDATDIFYQCDAWRRDANTGYGDFSFSGEESREWTGGRKRLAPEVQITTASPILEAYYKDSWGAYYGRDLEYGLNIFVWFEELTNDRP